MKKSSSSRKAPYISIIVPTWNEAGNIQKVLNGIRKTLTKYNYEIILVDRHSTDGTSDIAKRLGARIIYDDVGKGSALIKGFYAAKGKILISMDADMSNRPNELYLLIAGIEAGYDICMGSRFMVGGGTSDMPFYRKFGNRVFVTLVNVIYGSKYSDMCYGYRSITHEAVRKMRLKEEGFGIETEINIKAKTSGLNIIEIPSFEKSRENGEAKLKSLRDGMIIMKTIIKNIGR